MMEQAIKKAIEGGYRKDVVQSHADLCSCGGSITCAGKEHYNSANIYKICLDPLFWQALGKQQGWGKNEELIEKKRQDIDCENRYYESAVAHPTETAQFYNALEQAKRRIGKMYLELDALLDNKDWKTYWHSFIDHRIEGKSADSFFEQILK